MLNLDKEICLNLLLSFTIAEIKELEYKLKNENLEPWQIKYINKDLEALDKRAKFQKKDIELFKQESKYE